MTGEEKVE